MSDVDILIKGALLHDIGKVCLRADHSLGNHSQAGSKFLRQFLDSSAEAKRLLHCIDYHHGKAMSQAKPEKTDLSYIVYEADNISAGADRRDNEGDTKGFDAQACLESVFNTFGEQKSASRKSKYRLRGMDPKKAFNYPTTGECLASDDIYEGIVNYLTSNFRRAPILEMSNDELLRILEDTISFVPSSTARDQVCDISLYVHCKIAAAIAACMYQYFAAEGLTDYKKQCFTDNKAFRKVRSYLLVSGDFSGIQNFIYTIPSKGAMKSLRGRSFYLELFMENYVDEILAGLGLCRANLLYTGGGHFYILAANTTATKEAIAKLQSSCNQWLLRHFGTKLYMAMGSAPCAGDDLLASGSQRSVFAAVSENLNKNKLCRYDESELKELFDNQSSYNQNTDGSRECSVCHMSSTELIADNPISDGDICPHCLGLYALGGKLFDKNKVFAILDTKIEGSLELFGYERPLYLAIMGEKELESYKEQHLVRLYSKNDAVTGNLLATRLWLADYLYRDEAGKVLELGELAKEACDENHGIKRLGVLRADVDNLGAAFIAGFVRNDLGDDPMRYATLSRYADLSRDLGMFFKLAVTKLCAGDLSGLDDAPFSLFGLAKGKERKVSVVYSGGDDMFLVGAWDDLLELAVDIRRAFKHFSCDKLSFSAGLALFNPSYPISKMAEITGMLEDAAKKMPGKDSIALFGFDTEQKGSDSTLNCQHVFKWQEFIDKVCGEKLNFLLATLDFDENSKDNAKIAAGTSLLYKLMPLLEENASGDKINLARFAYTLARLQPKDNFDNKDRIKVYNKFSETMYQWYRNSTDKKELRTALHLLVYYLRAKEE